MNPAPARSNRPKRKRGRKKAGGQGGPGTTGHVAEGSSGPLISPEEDAAVEVPPEYGLFDLIESAEHSGIPEGPRLEGDLLRVSAAGLGAHDEPDPSTPPPAYTARPTATATAVREEEEEDESTREQTPPPPAPRDDIPGQRSADDVPEENAPPELPPASASVPPPPPSVGEVHRPASSTPVVLANSAPVVLANSAPDGARTTRGRSGTAGSSYGLGHSLGVPHGVDWYRGLL